MLTPSRHFMLQQSSDGMQFEILLAAANELSRATLSSGEDDTDITIQDDAIGLSNVTSSVLGTVIVHPITKKCWNSASHSNKKRSRNLFRRGITNSSRLILIRFKICYELVRCQGQDHFADMTTLAIAFQL